MCWSLARGDCSSLAGSCDDGIALRQDLFLGSNLSARRKGDMVSLTLTASFRTVASRKSPFWFPTWRMLRPWPMTTLTKIGLGIKMSS
jgi:hypothetical protein